MSEVLLRINKLVRMPTYYFPIAFLRPSDDLAEVDCAPFGIARRKWETTMFDLATLGSKHKLHMPFQLMDVMLKECNSEIWIQAEGVATATDTLSALLLCLYTEKLSPTISPFVSTYSINAYSGINSRDSAYDLDRLPEGMREGINSTTDTVECWPMHMALTCLRIKDALRISPEQFRGAAAKASKWLELEKAKPALRAVREAAQAAPLLFSRDQSLLHIWCALESLFPQVSTEVNFRLGLYLAQLGIHKNERAAIFKQTKSAYNMRSRVAHGSTRNITYEQWLEAWNLLLFATNAILSRGGLPSEDSLLSELLADNQPL